MSRLKDAMIGCWEAGAVLVEIEEVREWRAAGHTVPLVWVPATNWQGATIRLPAVSVTVAERLAASLDDEQARSGLSAAVQDYQSYMGAIGRRCDACGVTGQPHYFVNTGAETLCVDCG